MAIDPKQRRELRKRAEEVFGADEAETLMELLPPIGWADFATKQDLETLREATARDIEICRLAMEARLERGLREQLVTFLGACSLDPEKQWYKPGGNYTAAEFDRDSKACTKSRVLDEECQGLLKATVNELGLSARAHDKILRLARTIADLAASERILPDHISEAINYRMLDRNLWK